MKGFIKSLSAMLITVVMAASVAMPVSAAGSYTPIAAKNATFNKYLLVDGDATAPATTFSYTISSTDVTEILPGTSTTLPVYKGTGTPTIADVSFATTDTAETSTLVTGYNTYKKTITIDMSSVSFTEPGVYRYYIKEVKPQTPVGGMYYDVDAVTPDLTQDGDLYRTLDIYVEDDSATAANTLKLTGYIMYDGMITDAPPSGTPTSTSSAITDTKAIEVNTANGAEVANANKTDNYVNYYTSQSLTFGKVVTGNQGSRDKYFKMTLSLKSPVDATVTVDVSNADASVPAVANLNKATDTSYAGATNATSIALTANTAVETAFYLQHGQYIIVNGIPVGTDYELTETPEGYTSTEGITQTVSVINWDGVAGNDALSDAVSGKIKVDDGSDTTTDDGDIQTGYTNDKQGLIPTGVLLTMTPVIVVAVIVVAGVAFFAVRSAKRKAYELAEADSETDAE